MLDQDYQKRFGFFDNRLETLMKEDEKARKTQLLTRIKSSIRGRRSPLYVSDGAHLKFLINEEEFVYAYIRKNGCTAFSRFLSHEFPRRSSRKGFQRLKDDFQVTRHQELISAKCILVLRDPIKRVTSLFRNKLIQRDRASDILKNVGDLTGKSYKDLTFEDFIYTYIADNIDFKEGTHPIDPHCKRQVNYLWPIVYDRVFMLEDLTQKSIDLFGKEIGERYFSKRQNASESEPLKGHLSTVKVSKLSELWEKKGLFPNDNSLVTNDIGNMIHEIYALDYALIKCSGLVRA